MKVNRKPGSTKNKLSLLNPSVLQQITGNALYYYVTSGAIVVSCATLGFATQARAKMVVEALETDRDYYEPMYLHATQAFFTLFFAIDLGLRWASAGLYKFWRSEDRFWHGLDLLCVVVGALEMPVDMADRHHSTDVPVLFLSNFTVLRALRLAKLVQVVKMVSLMRFFREFRLMLFGTIASMKFFLGVVLVVFFSLYGFGLFFTTSATRYLLSRRAEWEAQKSSELFNSFGTLDRTLLSLYMSISGGNDWIVYYDILTDLSDGCDILFLLFITFVLFAVLNIVTAVFLDSASRLNMAEDRMIVEEEITTKGQVLDCLRRLFEEVDLGGFGTVTQEEFENQLKDDKINAFFHALKLDTRDARRLFMVLDQNGSGEVDIDEFITGCYELQGQASSLDSKIMQMEVSFIRDRMVALGESIRHLDKSSLDLGLRSRSISDPYQ